MNKIIVSNKNKNYFVNLYDLVHILDNLNLNIKDIKQISYGWKNITFIAKLKNNKKLFIKCFKHKKYLLNELKKYRLVKGVVNIPKLFFSVTSKINLLIYEYIENSDSLFEIYNSSNKDIDKIFRDIAISLAKIHNIKPHKEQLEIPTFNMWFPIFLKNKNVLKILGKSRVLKIINIKNKYKKEIDEIENYLSFCHCDFKTSNIIINSQELYIVDWEFSSYCYSFLDIGQLFREKSIFMSNKCISIFEKNYNEIIIKNKLPKNWTIHIKLIDIGNLLQMISNNGEKGSLSKIKCIIKWIDNYINYLI